MSGTTPPPRARPPFCDPIPTTLNLELHPEFEAQLTSEAQNRGLPLQIYVENLLKSAYQEDEELQEGLDDIAAGRTRPTHEFFADFRERHGIRD